MFGFDKQEVFEAQHIQPAECGHDRLGVLDAFQVILAAAGRLDVSGGLCLVWLGLFVLSSKYYF